MSKGNRKESKVEFDNNYFKIYADYMRLKSNNFGVKNEMLVTQPLRVLTNYTNNYSLLNTFTKDRQGKN